MFIYMISIGNLENLLHKVVLLFSHVRETCISIMNIGKVKAEILTIRKLASSFSMVRVSVSLYFPWEFFWKLLSLKIDQILPYSIWIIKTHFLSNVLLCSCLFLTFQYDKISYFLVASPNYFTYLHTKNSKKAKI